MNHMNPNPVYDTNISEELVRKNGLTPAVCDAFTFLNHRGVQAPAAALEGEPVVSKADVATANLRLSMYGYTMSLDLLQECLKASEDGFHSFFDALIALVSKESCAIEMADMVWPNYPYDVMDASLGELYLANVINYLSMGTVQVQFTPKAINPALPDDIFERSKQIPLCPPLGAQRLIVQMVTNNTPMSENDLNEVRSMLSDHDFALSVAEMMKDREIPIKENLALYVAIMAPILGSAIDEQRCLVGFKTAKDVLRLAVAYSDGDVTLATNTRFRSFKRSERKLLLSLIERTSHIAENMANEPERWKRLGEKLHPGEYLNQFPKTVGAFCMIRSGASIPTFNSIMEKLMRKPIDVSALADHLMTRPGMFARYLDFCLRNSNDESERNQVAFKFISVAQAVSPRVLLQMINHFRNRNNHVRLAVGKKDGAAAKALDRGCDPLPADFCNRLSKDLANELWQLLRKNGNTAASVYIDPEAHCEKLIFPDSLRVLSPGSRVAACGSRFSMPEGNIIRCFLYWKGQDTDIFDGIDIDLSVGFYDADFEHCNAFISYFSPAVACIHGVHSGDRRSSGVNGSAEYVDFDISAAKAVGIRYAVLFANSFSGDSFASLETAFCGLMVRDGITGDIFEPATVTDRYDLVSESRDIAAVVLDLMTREVIVVDRSTGLARGQNLLQCQEAVGQMCRYAIELKSLKLVEMLQFRFASKTDDWQNASIIVTDHPDKFKDAAEEVRFLNPYDAPEIYDMIFGDINDTGSDPD